MKKIVLFLLIVFSRIAYSQWEPCNNGFYGGSIEIMVADGNYVFAWLFDAGIYYSSNSGSNWTKMNTSFSYSDKWTGCSEDVMYLNGNKLFVGVDKIIYLTTDYGNTWVEKESGIISQPIYALAGYGNYIFVGTRKGLFVSSDNGDNWQEKDSGITNKYCEYITVSGNNIYTATSDAIYLSTDNGDNWIKQSKNISNSGCIAADSNNVYLSSYYNGIFISNDYGKTWVQHNSGLTKNCFISICIFNKNIYAGINGGGIIVSTDNGNTWLEKNSGLTSNSPLCFASYGDKLYVGTLGGGVFLTTDNGDSWTQMNNDLECSTIYGITAIGKNLFAGTNDNGMFVSTDNGNSWAKKNSGLTSPNIWCTANIGNEVLIGTGNGLFMSTDNGNSWLEKDSGFTGYSTHFIAVTGNKIYAATDSNLFLSTNNGESWILQNSRVPQNWIDCLAVSDSNVFLGVYGVGLLIYSVNKDRWTSPSSGMDAGLIKNIAITGNNIIVVETYDGIFSSNDNGKNWIFINSDFVYDYLSIINCFYTYKDYIIAGTEKGFYVSNDDANTWFPKNIGLVNTDILSISNNDDYFFVGTVGGGMYRAKINDIIITNVNDINTQNNLLAIYPNPANDFVVINTPPDVNNKIIQIYNIFGIKVLEKEVQQVINNLYIESLPEGVYYIRMGAQTRMFVKE
ncbi:MAG: T9SS type A sorting domain-containing protein [Bacteroidetes bacterium]|nr:MAG: T9SS type A sorting domain-containing protein [Bacteroidota bacterium]